MDYNLSPAHQEYQRQVRAWVKENLAKAPKAPHRGEESPEQVRERYGIWQRMRSEAGMTCVMWPEQFGGAGKGVVEHYIVSQEIDALDVVQPINIVGFGICLPTVLHFGSEAQKTRHLPPAVQGEHVWCQLFSEPGCGSDLASLSTRAVPDGPGWRLTGQKTWTSFAHFAEYGLCLARTEPDAPKHRGLTMFIVDMNAPGITVQPVNFNNGDHDFNEVFLDDAYVGPESVVGQVNEGWSVAIGTLMVERGTSNIHVFFKPWLERCLNRASQVLQQHPDAPGAQAHRQQLARMITRAKIMELQGLRVLAGAEGNAPPGPEGSFVKLLWSETNQELAALTLDILGPMGALLGGDDAIPENGWFPKGWLRSFGNTLEGGSSEILRNIVAERILGLPKDPTRAMAAAPPQPR